MHKKLVNELRLTLRICPQGPLLIKSGQEAGANPTLLDMNFVRTHHATLGDTVYLPGSSLKGAIRSYCEKIGRTVGLAVCNPLDMRSGCGHRLERRAKIASGAELYQELCPICRIFGHTVMASHLHISDAYPTPETLEAVNATEERDGVAIDRVSGAVAVGPFQLEVVTRGAFETTLTLHNFQLWQVGLLAIALRDLGEQRVPLGFARSRGLGRVSVQYVALEIAYPGQFVENDAHAFNRYVYGVTAFTPAEEYGYFAETPLPLPQSGALDSAWGRVSLTWQDSKAIAALLKATVAPWGAYVQATKGAGG
ncbi:MAG TPA: RAMP superfamily CRISPR-associated protein [Anaerolineae bacterium]|nr:RAMP superfamily CRISPR-associated protein [Anaerolineae bacterium]HQK15067.1 RAMP superfamily CRISPR-associated protein [Anaerolineae bacterium]